MEAPVHRCWRFPRKEFRQLHIRSCTPAPLGYFDRLSYYIKLRAESQASSAFAFCGAPSSGIERDTSSTAASSAAVSLSTRLPRLHSAAISERCSVIRYVAPNQNTMNRQWRAGRIYQRFKHHFLTDKEKRPRAIKGLDGLPAKCPLPRQSQTWKHRFLSLLYQCRTMVGSGRRVYTL